MTAILPTSENNSLFCTIPSFGVFEILYFRIGNVHAHDAHTFQLSYCNVNYWITRKTSLGKHESIPSLDKTLQIPKWSP